MLTVSHTSSTGQGLSQAVDFKGYVLKRPTTDIESFRVKKDRTPLWLKSMINSLQPGPNGSVAFHVEGSIPDQWGAFIRNGRRKALNRVRGISKGQTHLALSEFKVIPKIIRRPGLLVASHQAHLI